jgi:hypothetical protein
MLGVIFGSFFFSGLVLSACVFYKSCNMFLSKICWSLFGFVKIFPFFLNHSFSLRI